MEKNDRLADANIDEELIGIEDEMWICVDDCLYWKVVIRNIAKLLQSVFLIPINAQRSEMRFRILINDEWVSDEG